MPKLKRCSICREEKEANKDFYICSGRPRTECKKCTSKKNVKRQRISRIENGRIESQDWRREYMKKYYHENKNKFAEYRKKFKESHPHYYKMYYQKQKNPQLEND